MNQDELKALFDQQASNYDKQWSRMAPINNGLHFLLESVFSVLPSDAQVLCVGAGTGRELIYLAKRFPGWRFTAVEPSGAMLNVCRQVAEDEQVASRCYFHEGYLDSLPGSIMYDAATSFLVSHFILDKETRSQFFHQIAKRLKPDGILANSDLSSDTDSTDYEPMLEVWLRVMSGSLSAEGVSRIKAAYGKDVAVLPPKAVAAIIESTGFEAPVQFFQAGLIRAWFAKRASGHIA